MLIVLEAIGCFKIPSKLVWPIRGPYLLGTVAFMVIYVGKC